MKKLYAYMKKCGKTTILEVVAYTEKECLEGAKMAVECGCDILMGTIFFDSINDYCKKHNLKYMLFVGKITERPSILDGSIEEMIAEAKEYLKKGVFGFDLLGYRYTGDAVKLNKEFVSNIDSKYICDAEKPKTEGYLKAVEMLDIKKEEAIFIGDQIFTDILGANKSGIANILVKFIQLDGETKVGKKRQIENILLKFYKKIKNIQID